MKTDRIGFVGVIGIATVDFLNFIVIFGAETLAH